MVSKASDDFPDPDSPVTTVSLSRGIVTLMLRRLCSRAPRTMSASEGFPPGAGFTDSDIVFEGAGTTGRKQPRPWTIRAASQDHPSHHPNRSNLMTSLPDPDHAVVLALTALPPELDAGAFARALLDARLVACVSMLPGARSVYRWQGRIEESTETIALLKTRADRVPLLREYLTSYHPYEVPELLVFPASDGLPAYLEWVGTEVGPRSDAP